MSITLRPYLPADANTLAELFQAAIEELADEHYSPAQRAAWAASAETPAFAKRLAGQLTLVALRDGEIAGFAALKGSTFDLLYVHPDHARVGVGRALADAVEKLAAARGVATLTVDASDAALGFFDQRGYLPQHRATVEREGEWLANTRMIKALPARAADSVSKPKAGRDV